MSRTRGAAGRIAGRIARDLAKARERTMRLRDRVAIVTSGAAGIGAASALAMAAGGAG